MWWYVCRECSILFPCDCLSDCLCPDCGGIGDLMLDSGGQPLTGVLRARVDGEGQVVDPETGRPRHRKSDEG